MMLRYILIVVLIGVVFSEAYKRNAPRRREYIKSQPDYEDYDEYNYPIYAKESEATSARPSIFSYWNRLLKRTRLPRWNITNPFSKLFSPYVIKIDFPPGSEPDVQPTRTKTKKKDPQQEDYVYMYSNNVEPENPHYFYDPVTQQYYEVQETASQDYNPYNNYYATTFNDDDEIVINMGEPEQEHNQAEVGEYVFEEDVGNVGFMGKYNKPAIAKSKSRRFGLGPQAPTVYRKLSKRSRKSHRLATV